MQPPMPPPAAAPSAPEPQFNSSADQNLAEMAQRLEAALRRPANAAKGSDKSGDDPRGAAAAPRAEPAEDEMEEAPPPALPARAAAPAEIARPQQRGEAPRPPRAAPAQAAPQKSLYDSLEQEMASLLGRPNSKP
jgi:hypothetical protein